ncbi:hypothetical protein DL765_003169 [Monosporascus sp. GIB2]|nr:hypothetical protein DL765_003169 [Monosporascus sp. GIB2]
MTKQRQYSRILNHTHHIIFLETPHAGLFTEGWRDIYGSLASEAGESQFRTWSDDLGKLASSFADFANRIAITSVYAGSAVQTPEKTFEVEIDEAPSTLQRITSTGFSVDAQVLRRRGPREMLQGVRNRTLSTERSKAMKDIQAHDRATIYGTDDSIQNQEVFRKIKQWLESSITSLIPYKEDLRLKSTALDRTCGWLSSSSKYKEWVASSTLIAYLIKSLQDQEQRVLYIFCQEAAKLDLSDRINCLTLQMAEVNDKVLMEIRPNYDKSAGTSLRSPLTAATVFRKALGAFGQCYVFVDALDECAEEDRGSLVRILLEAVRKIPYGLNIMCASRNEPDLLDLLGHNPTIVDLSIRPEDTKNDISLVIQADIEKQPNLAARLLSSPAEVRDDIVDSLTQGANGMFLLPKLMIKDLNTKTSSGEIYALLENLPSDLHQYYIKAVNRIGNCWMSTARQIITWTAWAHRPLRVEELKDALEFQTGECFFNLGGDLEAACSGLIVVDDGEVKFNHSSVRRFLRESEAFKQDGFCRQFLVDDPDDHLADVCTRYIFGGWCSLEDDQSGRRFKPTDTESLKKTSPFLEYACHYWISHCRASKQCTRFVQAIWEFVDSPQFWDWCEVLAQFSMSDPEPLRYYCTILQTFVNELKIRLDAPDEDPRRNMLESTSRALAKYRGFIWQWEDALTKFPRESLMPSTPWDRSHEDTPLKPEVAEEIRLRTEGIASAKNSAERYGLDPADVGSLQAYTVLRKDLQAVAITWARFNPDKTRPIDVKTYVFCLHERENSVDLERIGWTDRVDPCRVDVTSTYTFKKSKCPLAFTEIEGRSYLWTAGGRYDVKTGKRTLPPFMFRDKTLSALTFSRDASVIAGIRNASRLEVFSLPGGRRLSAVSGKCTILEVSPCGTFVLFLKNVKPVADGLTGNEGLFLLCHGKSSKIWAYKERAPDLDLEYFYNNGGLHSFSETESTLVICVPTEPEWSLLVFDLTSADVAASVRSITCSQLLLGADILSFTFCPTHENRIYVLGTRLATSQAAESRDEFRRLTTSSSENL